MDRKRAVRKTLTAKEGRIKQQITEKVSAESLIRLLVNQTTSQKRQRFSLYPLDLHIGLVSQVLVMVDALTAELRLGHGLGAMISLWVSYCPVA